MTSTESLGSREIAILDFEKTWWIIPGTKDAEIRSRFGISEAQYYQELNTLIDSPAALAHDPLLVKRLRRQRAERRSSARQGNRQSS